MEGDNGKNPAIDALEKEQGKVADTLELVLKKLDGMGGEIEALRAAPQKQLPDRKDSPPVPKIEVGSRWDNHSAFQMCLYHQLHSAFNRPKGSWFDDKFMRALAVKVEDEVKADEKRAYMRAIDAEARETWGKFVPHLRADEAMYSTLSSYGDELVPTLMSTTAWREFVLATQVMKQFPIFEMPSNPYEYPVVGSGPAVRLVAEITDQSQFTPTAGNIHDAKIGTSKKTFSANGIGAMTLFSQTLWEDANFDILRIFADSFVVSMAQAMDEVLVSGSEDATVTNISHYGTDPTDTDYDKILAMDGLRQIAVDNSDTVAHTTISKTSFLTLQQMMGTRGVLGIDPRVLVGIVDPGVYYKILALDAYESIADVGEHAILITGVAGFLRGVPFVVSDQLENTNASGQIEDSHDSSMGSFLVAHRTANLIGRRRDVQIETDRIVGTTGRVIWSTVRFDVQSMQDGSVTYGYNTTV